MRAEMDVRDKLVDSSKKIYSFLDKNPLKYEENHGWAFDPIAERYVQKDPDSKYDLFFDKGSGRLIDASSVTPAMIEAGMGEFKFMKKKDFLHKVDEVFTDITLPPLKGLLNTFTNGGGTAVETSIRDQQAGRPQKLSGYDIYSTLVGGIEYDKVLNGYL